MNDTIINIEGITIVHQIHYMQDSTDRQHELILKDEYGSEVRVSIAFGKINNLWKK